MQVEHPHTPARIGRVLPLPVRAPRVGRNALLRWIGRSILKLGGWRMEGEFPNVPKLVLIGAPHSSNWDGIWGFAALLAMDLDLRVLGKKELFWGPMAWLMRLLRVIPIDRKAPGGFVAQSIDTMNAAEQLWIGLAPEGTRKRVKDWKNGFWKLARGADVPVVMAYFHYPDKVIGIGPVLNMGADVETDMARIRQWYRPWQGKNRGTV
ncbi:acyltransferase [Lysobacteraceae bacterium NML75-0749]|nr:acyltransferase [Xanthomonadaceae bacterium NML75-0749]PJK01555.1 acyltransferase [Xanthomonadaceae bacterium NML03-0222]PJK04825.1 acyltransferase [Xanthomonadaceae bacterium NML91-0268]